MIQETQQQSFVKIDKQHIVTQLIQTYFKDHKVSFDKHFVGRLIELAESDAQLSELISNNCAQIIRSKHRTSKQIFQLALQKENLNKIAIDLMNQVIITNPLEFQSSQISLTLQKFLIEEIWSSQFHKVYSTKLFLQNAISFLCFKMRSLHSNIRKSAVQSFSKGATLIMKAAEQTSNKSEAFTYLSMIAKQMIEKETLIKEVSYTKGVFLQVLEDEYHQIRIICMRCLLTLRQFYKINDLKLIFIYMLNDQHEAVRKEALTLIIAFKNKINLIKQDLQTILMCLRQKQGSIRHAVYECLANIELENQNLLYLLIDRVNNALMANKSDKRKIYSLYFQIGLKYKALISNNFSKLYAYNDEEEPNYKIVVYKAKLVLLYHSIEVIRESCPLYFIRHMMYMKNAEAYLFQQESFIVEEQPTILQLGDNPSILLNYIQSQAEISDEFHQILFQFLTSTLRNNQKQKMGALLQNSLILYDLDQNRIGLVRQMQSGAYRQLSRNEFIDLLKRTVQSKNRGPVQLNKCIISKDDPSTIISSKSTHFTSKIYLKCQYHPYLTKKSYNPSIYYKLSTLKVEGEDSKYQYYKLNANQYSQIECFVQLTSIDNSKSMNKRLDKFQRL